MKPISPPFTVNHAGGQFVSGFAAANALLRTYHNSLTESIVMLKKYFFLINKVHLTG